LQAVASQTYGAQFVFAMPAHEPEPSHEPALLATPLEQEPGTLHAVPFGVVHAVVVLPSHVATPHTGSLVGFVHTPRLPWGAPPPGTGTHVPIEPGTSHAWQSPPHARLQQTPSTQLPDEHSPLAAHPKPFCTRQVPSFFGSLHFAPVGQLDVPQQTPSTQYVPAAQVPGPEHVLPSPARGTHCWLALQ
jgi:hypothetical protein